MNLYFKSKNTINFLFKTKSNRFILKKILILGNRKDMILRRSFYYCNESNNDDKAYSFNICNLLNKRKTDFSLDKFKKKIKFNEPNAFRVNKLPNLFFIIFCYSLFIQHASCNNSIGKIDGFERNYSLCIEHNHAKLVIWKPKGQFTFMIFLP